VVGEWDGHRVQRWGYTKGTFRHLNSYEKLVNNKRKQPSGEGSLNVLSLQEELAYWKKRCIRAEDANTQLRALVDGREKQQVAYNMSDMATTGTELYSWESLLGSDAT
jgi:hypothetical protein